MMPAAKRCSGWRNCWESCNPLGRQAPSRRCDEPGFWHRRRACSAWRRQQTRASRITSLQRCSASACHDISDLRGAGCWSQSTDVRREIRTPIRPTEVSHDAEEGVTPPTFRMSLRSGAWVVIYRCAGQNNTVNGKKACLVGPLSGNRKSLDGHPNAEGFERVGN